jgi:signal transduction histidine kinase
MEYEQDDDGQHEWYTLSAEVLELVEGGAVITRSTVTMGRRAHIEIEEQRRELSHLARVAVLGQLSGAFAHELRQPLTSILVNRRPGASCSDGSRSISRRWRRFFGTFTSRSTGTNCSRSSPALSREFATPRASSSPRPRARGGAKGTLAAAVSGGLAAQPLLGEVARGGNRTLSVSR